MGWHTWKGYKRSYRKKVTPVLDCDYGNTESSKPSTVSLSPDDVASSDVEEAKDSLLDQCLEDLCYTDKRSNKRLDAMLTIWGDYESVLKRDFVFTTVLQQCLCIIKNGYAADWAADLLGRLALTAGPGEKAQEMLKISVDTISEALRKHPEKWTTLSLLRYLAVITSVGGEEPEDIENSMQIIWEMAHPRLGPNVAAANPSPAIIKEAVSSWSFLLITVDGWSLNPESWQGSMSYFSTLLDHQDKSVRIAAGMAVALIVEMRILQNFCGETEELTVAELKKKVIKQLRDLSAEAGGKVYSKKGLKKQRNTFHDIVKFIEDRTRTPETSIKFGGQLLRMSTWAQLIQWNFMTRYLKPGFSKHMQNEYLHDVLGFTPKKTLLSGFEKNRMSRDDKEAYMSINSRLEKARTRYVNKERTFKQVRNIGRYAVGFGDDE